MAFAAPILSLTKRSTTAELPATTSYSTRDLLPSFAVPSQVPARLCSFAKADCASASALQEWHGCRSRNAAKTGALDNRLVNFMFFLQTGDFIRLCLP